MRTFGKAFWSQAFERAIKTAAQAGILAMGSDALNYVPSLIAKPGILLSALGGGAVLSILTSIVTAPVGEPGSPSAVTIPTA